MVFSSFQYISSALARRMYIEREDTYLTVLSIPAMLIVSRFVTYFKRPEEKFVSMFAVCFLFVTSIPTLISMYTYNRQIIVDTRDSFFLIRNLPEKTIYIPEGIYPQMAFFFNYKKSNLLRLYYEDVVWKDIKDAYVIVNATPCFGWNNPNRIPDEWLLLKTFEANRESYYNNYNTKVYYAP